MKDDLISRQAAIDAIKEFQHGAAEWRDEQEERSDIWHRADSAIASAFEIGLRVKKLPPAQQWIPCSERLPEENGRYLVTNSAWGAMEVDWNAWVDGAWLYPNTMPIAWMPLPEPYKADEEVNT